MTPGVMVADFVDCVVGHVRCAQKALGAGRPHIEVVGPTGPASLLIGQVVSAALPTHASSSSASSLPCPSREGEDVDERGTSSSPAGDAFDDSDTESDGIGSVDSVHSPLLDPSDSDLLPVGSVSIQESKADRRLRLVDARIAGPWRQLADYLGARQSVVPQVPMPPLDDTFARKFHHCVGGLTSTALSMEARTLLAKCDLGPVVRDKLNSNSTLDSTHVNLGYGMLGLLRIAPDSDGAPKLYGVLTYTPELRSSWSFVPSDDCIRFVMMLWCVEAAGKVLKLPKTLWYALRPTVGVGGMAATDPYHGTLGSEGRARGLPPNILNGRRRGWARLQRSLTRGGCGARSHGYPG